MLLYCLRGGRVAFSSPLRAAHKQFRPCLSLALQIQRTTSTQAKEKYAQKLQKKAAESGTTVDELVQKAKSKAEEQSKREGEALRATFKPSEEVVSETTASGSSTSHSTSTTKPSFPSHERKDASPFKPLSTFLSLPRLFSTPHTSEQISALWTAYHASRSNGTGRGYVCASIPVELYKNMLKPGQTYPAFVVPIRRLQTESQSADIQGEEEKFAHEFYFMQWDFHPAPPRPSASDDDPFVKKDTTARSSGNPPIATVLFTPLQEYKLRQTFATPYLVLTMYTDLAESHGLVLLRGEITPGSGSGERFLLSQEDAQQLVLALQKFYLWSDAKSGVSKGQELLRTFHEKPEEFEWKELQSSS